MKILTRQGEVVLSDTDLASYDAKARKQLTKLKRAKLLKVVDGVVHFELVVRGTVPPEIQQHLRHLANLRKHGKAYAPEQADVEFQELHTRISGGHAFLMPVEFNLDTGVLTIAKASET
jgi:hypothetical protein